MVVAYLAVADDVTASRGRAWAVEPESLLKTARTGCRQHSRRRDIAIDRRMSQRANDLHTNDHADILLRPYAVGYVTSMIGKVKSQKICRDGTYPVVLYWGTRRTT